MDESALAELRLLNPWAIRLDAFNAMARRATTYANLEPPQAVLAAAESAGGGSVAVIPLRGLITPRGSFLSLLFGGGGGLQAFRQSLREALGNDEVGAIVLDVDSPGGSVEMVPETAAEVFAARERKPIVAIANTWAASAAYWIASQADELYVTPSGEVGSIGIFSVHEDWSGWNEQKGIQPTYISAGKYKVEGNPDEPLSDEAKAAEQRSVDDYYDAFVADVARGRSVTPAAVRDGFGEGRLVTSKRSVALGMADGVETYESVVASTVTTARERRSQLPRATAKDPAGDNPVPNSETDDEARARTARLVAHRPVL